MAAPPAEPFHQALTAIRARIQTGVLLPGGRAIVVDLADDLGLSTTPVREALSRLAGEGVLEDRRGQGYFVRRLGATDVADLYRMSLAHLLIALEPRRTARFAAGAADTLAAEPDPPGDPVADVEALFRGWVAAGGGRLLVSAFRVVQIQLGPVRRLEPRLFGQLEAEARSLRDPQVARSERLTALRQFHAARIRVADRLAGLLEAATRETGK